MYRLINNLMLLIGGFLCRPLFGDKLIFGILYTVFIAIAGGLSAYGIFYKMK